MFVLKLFLPAVFFAALFSYGQDEVLSVCERTPQVRAAVVSKIKAQTGVEDCSLMKPLLSLIKWLNLEKKDITELQPGDFSGLSSLTSLNFGQNQISVLPEGIFSGLSSLEQLYFSFNQISDLPEGVFSGLSSLESLYLGNNELSVLPEGVFSGLSSLDDLSLGGNLISDLPGSVFELPSLRHLTLIGTLLNKKRESIRMALPSVRVYF